MRKLIFFMHTSLDGFISGLHGEMNWINVDENMFDFIGTMTDKSDTALPRWREHPCAGMN